MTEKHRQRESVDMWNSVGWKRMIETNKSKRERHKQRETQAEINMDREKHRQRETFTERNIDREKHRQTGKGRKKEKH